MHLRQLRYLRLIIEHGSFAAAGRTAGVGQSAISQAMGALAHELGVALFQKNGRRRVPTPAALRIAQRGEELEHGLARENNPPDSRPRNPAVLQVGMSAAATLLYATTIQVTWQARHPEGLLKVSGGTAPRMLAALRRGELDLVIAPRPRGWHAPDVRAQLLFRSAAAVYARPGHPLARARSLVDLQGAAWAAAGPAGTPGNTIEEALRVRNLPPPRIVAECTDYPTLVHLAVGTDLLIVLPHPAAAPSDGRIVALRLREGLPKYEVCLFRPNERRPSLAASVDAVTDALLAVGARHDPGAKVNRTP